MSPTSAAPQATPVVLLARPATGGIRSHLLQLLVNLDRSRYQVTLAAPDELLESVSGLDLPETTFYSLAVTPRPTLSDFANAARLTAITRRLPGALLHAHGIRAGFVAALAKLTSAQMPLIVTYHNIPPQSPLSHTALRFIADRSSAQIAVSRAIAARLPGSLPAQVIPNGIDLNHFRPIVPDMVPGTDSAGQSRRVKIGAVARLSREKGIDILLEAARATPHLAYLVAGTGPDEDRLRSFASHNVRFLGYVADTREVYAACDIVVIPSRSEGQGIVALEAMACCKPVIASNVGGLAETISPGLTGILVEPGDEEALASAILALADDVQKRRQLGLAASAWAHENADVGVRTAQLEAVYDTVIARIRAD